MLVKLILNVDGEDPAPRRKAIFQRKVNATQAADKFWKSFHLANQTELKPRPSAPQMHSAIRAKLPVELQRGMIGKIAPMIGVHRSDVLEALGGEPYSGSDREYIEKMQALSALSFEVARIDYGSLEILVFAFAVAKLAALAGITSSDIATYVALLAPGALNTALGTNVPMTAEASVVDATPEVQTAAPQSARIAGLTLVQQGAPYLAPAVLALCVLGVGAWVSHEISTQLSEERTKLATDRHAEMENINAQRTSLQTDFMKTILAHESAIGDERKAAFDRMTDVTSRLATSFQKSDEIFEASMKALNAEQNSLIRQLSESGRSREAAMLEMMRDQHVRATPANRSDRLSEADAARVQ